MNRRHFIISLALAALGQGLRPIPGIAKNEAVIRVDSPSLKRFPIDKIVIEKDACPVPSNAEILIEGHGGKAAHQSTCLAPLSNTPPQFQADAYRQKMRAFNRHHPEDQYISAAQRPLLKSMLKRLGRLYRTVGHTNFYLLGIDDARKLSRNYQRIGRFKRAEMEFLEDLFHRDARSYGFFGKKQITSFTHQISKKDVMRIPRSGNFLYSGPAVELYQRLHRDIGSEAILTSGVRGIIKQTYLFLNKVNANRGNLSLASRSIAPPGYSYHGIGDFDVGQIGLGGDNFSARFIHSKVFKKLHALDYICLRYTEDNPFGVRFEPWHVMVGLSG